MLQRDLLHHVKTASSEARQKIEAAASSLDAAQLNEHPEPGGWSVAEVLEHLCISDDIYTEPLRISTQAARADAGAPLRDWKPSVLGGLIAGSLAKPRKIKAPRVFQPGATPRNGVLQKFLDSDTALMNLMDKSKSLDWRAIRLSSPALPRFAPRMNLGDIFRIHSVHTTRHATQIERLAAQLRTK